jgi:hypothetical protein
MFWPCSFNMPLPLFSEILIWIILASLLILFHFQGNLADILYERPITFRDPQFEATISQFSPIASIAIVLFYLLAALFGPTLKTSIIRDMTEIVDD